MRFKTHIQGLPEYIDSNCIIYSGRVFKHERNYLRVNVYLWLMDAVCHALWLAGCSASKDSGDKVRDLDFSVVGDMDVPDEL